MNDDDDTRPGTPKTISAGEKRPHWTRADSSMVIVAADEAQTTTPIRSHHGDGELGAYPWDDWNTRAIAAGVEATVAELGRDVMRAAHQRVWAEDLQDECGWNDEGDAMIELALAEPQVARARWQWLIDTDGCRKFGTESG